MNVLLLAATLCFGHDCRPVDGTKFAIKPSDQSRQFVWTSADAKSVVFGTAAAKAAELDVAGNDLRDVTLSVRGNAARGWPAETTLAIQTSPQKAPEWTSAIAAKDIAKLTALRVPRGRVILSIAAPHHATARRALPADGNVALREVTLAPLPIVSGKVVKRGEKGDEPLMGAQVTRPDGKLAATTDEQGAFRAELSDPVPDELVVLHAGFGAKVVPLAKQLPPEQDLGAIQLAAGHALTVHVKLPDGVDPKKVHVALWQETPGRNDYTPIRSFVMAGKAGDFAFADLAPATYHVIVSGEGPLEHLSADVKMGDKDEEKSITVAPFRVEGTAKVGQRPIAAGSVGMNDRTRWETEMPIRDGKFGGVLWQTGVVHAWLRTDEARNSFSSPELGADPTAWTIELKDRRIAGRIFDAETKAPVERAELRIETATASSRGYMAGTVQPDGSYSVLTSEDGTYTLKVSAPRYMNETAKFDFAPADTDSQSHDFALTRGVAARLEVVTPAGQPIAGAMIVDGVNSDGHNPDRFFSTGPDGRATVQMKPNEVRTLWVIPREGSFAVARVSAGEKPVQIVVPPPAGALKLNIKREEKAKLYAAVVLRWNGELVPQPVMLRVGSDFGKLDRLPAGAYDVWSVLLQPGVAMWAPLTGYVPPWPPVRVGLTGGEAAADVVPQAPR
ncbi:MAG TPA: hypothetical protein VI670_01040 [Thermoanaerobaculia bacterium]|jgi:hypothetical protein